MNNVSSLERSDSPFGYGVSLNNDMMQDDGNFTSNGSSMRSSAMNVHDTMTDTPIAYTNITFRTFDTYSKNEQHVRKNRKFVAQKPTMHKKTKQGLHYRHVHPRTMHKKTADGGAVLLSILPLSFKAIIMPTIRGIDAVLTLFSRIKRMYVGIAISIVLGYVLGMYYWNTSSHSFSYPTRKHVLQKINDMSYTSAEYVMRPNSEKALQNVDMTQFAAVTQKQYTLQTGDTLLGIAIANAISVDTLISWNKISDALRIRQGKTLIIPNKDGLVHVVKRGESITSIAQQYSINENKILDMNDLKSAALTPDMKLFIPGVKLDSFDRGLVLGTVFQTPLAGKVRLTSAYGYRISPITNKRSFHNGIDITNNSYGSAIYAASGGVVTYVSTSNPVFGKIVIVRHARGFQSLYGHMSTISVQQGQRVGRGDMLGKVGNSGLSTGPHLHFSIIHNGVSVNPLKYIRL